MMDALYRRRDGRFIDVKPLSVRAKEFFVDHCVVGGDSSGWVGFTEVALGIFKSFGWRLLETHKKQKKE